MKRHRFLLVLLAVFATETIARAQAPTATSAGQRQGGGQRQGASQQGVQLQEAAAGLSARRVRIAGEGPLVTMPAAWWTNTALVTRLGLTDAQKARIESTFEAHRQNLVSGKELLEKEEAQLAKLLEAESVDRGAVFTQINRVIQARGEMERTNATMTLEMREQLTRAQWAQLPVMQLSLSVSREYPLRVAPTGQPGVRGQRGGNGQQ